MPDKIAAANPNFYGVYIYFSLQLIEGIFFLALLQIPHNFPQFPPSYVQKQDYHT